MGLKCKDCCGPVLPVGLLSCKINWECVKCREKLGEEDANFVHSVWGVCLMNLSKEEDPHLLLKVLKEKIPKFVCDNNQVAVELKYKLVWILGYNEGYAWGGTYDSAQLYAQLYPIDRNRRIYCTIFY